MHGREIHLVQISASAFCCFANHVPNDLMEILQENSLDAELQSIKKLTSLHAFVLSCGNHLTVQSNSINGLLNDLCRENYRRRSEGILVLSSSEEINDCDLVAKVFRADSEVSIKVSSPISSENSFVSRIPLNSMFMLSEIPFPNDGLHQNNDWKISLFEKVVQPICVVAADTPFGAVVMDPPWRSHSVKRSRKYWTLENWQIREMMLQFPMSDWLSSQDSVVGIWVTNNPKVIEQAFEIANIWKLNLAFELHWYKLTSLGDYKFPGVSNHRQTYEKLLIFSKTVLQPPSVFRLYSLASCHSRKPDWKIIEKILFSIAHSERATFRLELFAREVSEQCFAVGNEVVLFNSSFSSDK